MSDNDKPIDEPRERPLLDIMIKEAMDLTQVNQARMEQIQAQGVQIDGAMILNTRLNALCDMVLGPWDKPDVKPSLDRTAYELRVQQGFTKMLDHIDSQIARARLTQGVAQPQSQLIVAKR
jgi:hypothetical protein